MSLHKLYLVPSLAYSLETCTLNKTELSKLQKTERGTGDQLEDPEGGCGKERRELEKTDVRRDVPGLTALERRELVILKPLVEIALEMSRLRESTGRQDPTVIT
uniref:Uncharacterized protein n=1 Tax=Timema genevievae TaxID=629358 RepID=A0A7R9PS56_TIMGE|nr:unnamed protein product [Timema genevievae]